MSVFFLEWGEREQHAEEGKKREQRMADGRMAGGRGGGTEPSLGSRLERGQRGACRLW